MVKVLCGLGRAAGGRTSTRFLLYSPVQHLRLMSESSLCLLPHLKNGNPPLPKNPTMQTNRCQVAGHMHKFVKK